SWSRWSRTRVPSSSPRATRKSRWSRSCSARPRLPASRRLTMSEHQHEEWPLHTRPDGGVSCSACGAKITPAKPDVAAVTVEWLYPALSNDDEELTYPRSALRQGKRDAYLRGRADERARIAARRDEAEEAIMRVRDAYPRRPDDAPSDEVTDAVLAALGVSE